MTQEKEINQNKLENYQSVFLGCAIGDALGMPVEGWKPQQIKRYATRITDFIDAVEVRDRDGALIRQDEFGKLGYYNLELQAGQYTDDTILTLALAESLIAEQGINIEDIAQRQLAEYTKRQREDGTVREGFGGTTREAFKNLLAGKSPYESGVVGGPGNAPAMKMSPMGLYIHTTGQVDYGLNAAEVIGKITHLDPRSLASGVVQAYAVCSLLLDCPRKDFAEALADVCRQWEKPVTPEFSLADKGTLTERLQWVAQHQDVSAEEAYQHLRSSSKVYSSYPFAVFMFQKYWDEPVNGLIETVNYGGDCDTTGAIYGALAGARHGLCWPEKWMQEVQNSEYLKELGNKMWEMGRN